MDRLGQANSVHAAAHECPPAGAVVGLIAGWGTYPVEVAKSLGERGCKVVTIALRDHAGEEITQYSHVIRRAAVARLGGHARFFQRHRVEYVIMAGKVFKDRILYRRGGVLSNLPDWKTFRTFAAHLLTRSRDSQDDTLLNVIAGIFEERGMRVIPGTDIATHLLAPSGAVAGPPASAALWRDALFGWKIAKAMGGLDIGQTVTVCNGSVIAVEAIEGTDRCIRRTGEICRGGFTMVKVAKPKQDDRFDMPTVGPNTIQAVAAAGGRAIVIEAGRTILLDREMLQAEAAGHGISVVALSDSFADQYQPAGEIQDQDRTSDAGIAA